MVDFKVVFNKQKYDISFPLDNKVSALKTHIQTLTGVTPAMQKLMFKGKLAIILNENVFNTSEQM